MDSLGVLVWSSQAVAEAVLDRPVEVDLEPGIYGWRVVGFFEDGLETQTSPLHDSSG